MTPPPLSLYVHVPWCLRKCPYCDFNSHALKGDLPEAAYVEALLADLRLDLERLGGASRPLTSLFIGGGTPSLLSPGAVARLLEGVRALLPCADDLEATLEANPGAVETGHFSGYRQAGVDRLSIGVQSLDPAALARLGRIHTPEEARRAVALARQAGFERLNLDLMFGLPEQSPQQALADLEGVIGLEPDHISWYQLTLEPNTAFHQAPPPLPDDESLWTMQEQGLERLAAAGFERYEISAFARPGQRCRHNLNYWRFGDYLGVGAGAHGKLTGANGVIRRYWKQRQPGRYLALANAPGRIQGERRLDRKELPLEFFMNALRLTGGVERELFEARTGLPLSAVAGPLAEARELGLLSADGGRLAPTQRGSDFLNDLLARFLSTD